MVDPAAPVDATLVTTGNADTNAAGGNPPPIGDVGKPVVDANLTPEQKAEKEAADKKVADDKAALEANLTPEQKAEKEAAEKKAADDKAKQAQSAPEKYEDFKAPEGVVLDGEVVSEFQAVAKELNLSQENAQKVIDRLAPKIAQKTSAQINDAVAKARTEWGETSKTDKEFGGDKLTENLGVAKKALDAFGTPELRNLLNETGLGNHPEVVRFFYRAGKAINEDRLVTGGRPAGQGKDDPRVMYPNSNHA